MLKINDGRKKVYVLLGRNSSGTSFISKALVDQGVDMGNLITDPPVYEDEIFLRFNEKILREAGGDWKNLPSTTDVENSFNLNIEEARKILKSNIHKKIWGWKDPRNSMLAEYWLNLLKELDSELDVYIICIFREPDRIAKSLADDDYDEMMALTKAYNESIVRIIKNFTNI